MEDRGAFSPRYCALNLLGLLIPVALEYSFWGLLARIGLRGEPDRLYKRMCLCQWATGACPQQSRGCMRYVAGYMRGVQEWLTGCVGYWQTDLGPCM